MLFFFLLFSCAFFFSVLFHFFPFLFSLSAEHYIIQQTLFLKNYVWVLGIQKHHAIWSLLMQDLQMLTLACKWMPKLPSLSFQMSWFMDLEIFDLDCLPTLTNLIWMSYKKGWKEKYGCLWKCFFFFLQRFFHDVFHTLWYCELFMDKLLIL